MRTASEPVVSVILPVYNGERTIRACVESVLVQTFSALELIAVDDGSTDGTGAILDEMASRDARVRVIHKKNGGVSAARNRALDEAAGTYVAFIDSDDRVEAGWLAAMTAAIEGGRAEAGDSVAGEEQERKRSASGTAGWQDRDVSGMAGQQDRGFAGEAPGPAYGMAICGYRTREAGTERDRKVTVFTRASLTPAEVIGRALRYRDITTAVWNKLLRRAVIEAHSLRFPTDLTIGEDMVFLTEYCLQIDRAVLIAEPLYIYMAGRQSAMREIGRGREFKESWLTEWQAILRTEALLAERGISLRETAVKKTRIAGKLLSAMDDCGYRDASVEAELRACLRENRSLILQEKEFGGSRKADLLLHAMSLAAARTLRRIWKKRTLRGGEERM